MVFFMLKVTTHISDKCRRAKNTIFSAEMQWRRSIKLSKMEILKYKYNKTILKGALCNFFTGL